MQQARESLKGKWGLAVGTFFLYFLVTIAVQSIPKGGFLLSLIIDGPLLLGLSLFTVAISRKSEAHLDQLFDGFRRFGTALSAYLLMTLFTVLWSLLLIVPGIVAALSYSMTFFILIDDVTVTPQEAIKRSKKMMYGYKWKLFCLSFRFIGWILLSILTLGIGFLWLAPYMEVSMVKFYDDLKNNSEVPAAV